MFFGAMLMAQLIKNLPAMQETWVRSLGWEDPLEKGMATTPVFSPRESCGQRSLGGYSPWCCKELDTTERLSISGDRGMDEVTFGVRVSHAAPSDFQATELFLTLVSELRGLSADELIGLWGLSFKCRDNW